MRDSQTNLYKKLFGKVGEDKAVEFLKERKYKILARNFKCPFGEADIISEYYGMLVFTEVKTRNGEIYGSPIDAVDYIKQQKYVKIAQFYVHYYKLYDVQVRFDVIEIENGNINLITDAFN